MASMLEELEKLLRDHGAEMTPERRKVLEESIAAMRKNPPAKHQNPDRYDAKGMVPVGQDHPVDWNPKRK